MGKWDVLYLISVIILVIFMSGCTSQNQDTSYSGESSATSNKIDLSEILSSNLEDSSSTSNKIDLSKIKISSSYGEKAKGIAEAMDITNPDTRDGALKLIEHSSSGYYNADQIVDIWDYVNDHWTYVNDPNGPDYLASASHTTNIGYKGDCDDFAILLASYIKAIGGQSRVIFVYNEEKGGHYYAEVYASSKDKLDSYIKTIKSRYESSGSYYYHVEQKNGITGYWLNLDWSGSRPCSKFYYNDADFYYAYYSDGTYEKVYKSNEKYSIQLPTIKPTPKPTYDLSKLTKPTPKPTFDLSKLTKPTPTPTFDLSKLDF